MKDDRLYLIHIGETPSWFFSLRFHGVDGRVEPLKVRWQNIRLREFK